jgi:hypothetical protein
MKQITLLDFEFDDLLATIRRDMHVQEISTGCSEYPKLVKKDIHLLEVLNPKTPQPGETT